MPKIFKKEVAGYETEVAKLATAQVQLDSEKYRFRCLEEELKKYRILFYITMGVTIITFTLGVAVVAATVWTALKSNAPSISQSAK